MKNKNDQKLLSECITLPSVDQKGILKKFKIIKPQVS